jgi:preprotein translocase subunit SecA
LAIIAIMARLINWLGQLSSYGQLRQLDRLQALYDRMDDNQLREEFWQQVAAGRSTPRVGVIARLLERFRDSPTFHAIAVAACVFDRHPCDLPSGSTLYDEQRVAALLLTDRANVQMATGEGKTYAIAVAAAALLTKHSQVIVLVPNGYLAGRDKRRVETFLRALGVSCMFGVPGANFQGVAYTTLSGLCFEYLYRAYRPPGSSLPDYPGQAAVILDEIDAILLDQTLEHVQSRHLPSEEDLWSDVFRLIEQWDQQQYSHDPVTDAISLTSEAWEEVVALGRGLGKPVALLINLVSAGLWARRAVQGREYIIDRNAIHLINQITGQTYQTPGPRQAALEHLVLKRTPPLRLSIARINGLTLLRRHPHVVGLSGTARDDTLYYLQQLGTLTGEVLPRFPRYRGAVVTMLSESRARSLRYLADRIGEVSPRPVVVGTWSPSEARAVAEWLQKSGGVEPARLSVITSFDSATDVTAIDRAGEPGRVTVLSQGGSRGVDVRSPHRPLLLVLGRAMEPRLDRQFLGRVGRHGEAFDAEFVIDPNSPIWQPQFGFPSRLAGMMPLNRMLARSLRRLQYAAWLGRYVRRQRISVLSEAIGQVEAAVAEDFRQLRQQAGAADLRSHVAQLVAVLPTSPEAEQEVGAAGATSLEEQVMAAIERRVESDAAVRDFEAAIRQARGHDSESGPDGYRVPGILPGHPAELLALTRWLRREADRYRSSGNHRALLFRRQVEYAALQRLPARTTPHRRDPLEIEYETRIMAYAALATQIDHRLDALWLSGSRQTYHRRGAFAVRNVYQLSDLRVRLDVLKNLLSVDRPDELDDLYYSRDHQLRIPAGKRSGDRYRPETVTESAAAEPAHRKLTNHEREDLIRDFLAERDRQRGGLEEPRYAQLLLRNVLEPLVSVPSTAAVAALPRHIDLVIDALAAKGTSSTRDLQRDRRLIRDFTDHLYELGVLPSRLPHSTRLAGAVRRVRAFASTIPVGGAGALLLHLCLLGLGALFVVDGARRIEALDIVTDLFGLGTLLDQRPALMLFAVVITCHVVLRALGIDDPYPLITLLAPLLAMALAFLVYSRGFSNLGSTVLLGLALSVWLGALHVSHRFVRALVGADINIIVAAGSVLAYMVGLFVDGRPQVHLLVLVGVVAALAGPALPVSITSREYAIDRVRHIEDRARIRIPIDPVLASALVAYLAVLLVVGVRGPAAVIGFAVIQFAALTLLAIRRLRVNRVTGLLARLQVGSPLTGDGLRAYLRRAVVRTTVVAAAVLLLAIVPIVLAGGGSTTELLLAQWAGVVLVAGALAGASALSVGGPAPVAPDPRDDDARPLTLLKERLRSWRRLRFGWIWGAILLMVLLARPLRWIADALDLVEAALAVWRAILLLM